MKSVYLTIRTTGPIHILFTDLSCSCHSILSQHQTLGLLYESYNSLLLQSQSRYILRMISFHKICIDMWQPKALEIQSTKLCAWECL